MDTKNFSNFLLKICGIIILIYTAINIPTYISYYISYNKKNFSIFFISVILPNILPTIIGLLLYIRPNHITNKIIFDNVNINSSENRQFAILLEQVALSVLGVYMLFSSVSDISFHLANFIQGKMQFSQTASMDISFSLFIKDPTTLSTVIESIFSMWLVIKSKAIAKYIFRSSGDINK